MKIKTFYNMKYVIFWIVLSIRENFDMDFMKIFVRISYKLACFIIFLNTSKNIFTWFKKSNRFLFFHCLLTWKYKKNMYYCVTMVRSKVGHYRIIVIKWKFMTFFNDFIWINFATSHIYTIIFFIKYI